MRIFTKVRQMLLDTTEIKIDILQIQKKLENHDKNIELVFSYLDFFYLFRIFQKWTRKLHQLCQSSILHYSASMSPSL